MGGMDPGATASGEGAPDARAHDGPPRRRRRRRRRKPMEAAVSSDSAAGVAAQPEASASVAPAGDGEAGAEVRAEDAPGSRPILRLRNRRRRRRRPHGAVPSPNSGSAPDSAAEPAPGDSMAPAVPSPGPEAPGPEPGSRPARPRNRRRRRAAPPDSAPPDSATGDTGERRPRDAGMPDRTGSASAPRNRRGEGPRAAGAPGDAAIRNAPRESRDGRPRGDRPDRGRDRPAGRGRAAPPQRRERQLYSFDSVVDRGFDDVEEEAGTRRVHWTIVKRTTADQISRKPVSALYVLQRDGADSEFPSLGAARNEVNKTIVHPEKLTRSKAEYAAEKTGKK